MVGWYDLGFKLVGGGIDSPDVNVRLLSFVSDIKKAPSVS